MGQTPHLQDSTPTVHPYYCNLLTPPNLYQGVDLAELADHQQETPLTLTEVGLDSNIQGRLLRWYPYL